MRLMRLVQAAVAAVGGVVDLQARQTTEQIADNECATDRGDRTRTYRSACRFCESCLYLLRLLGNGRYPLCRRRCGIGGVVDCAVGSSAEAVHLRRGFVRDP